VLSWLGLAYLFGFAVLYLAWYSGVLNS